MRKYPALWRAVIHAIRSARLERELSQRSLSEKLDQHNTYIYEIEAGQHSVRTEEFITIAEALELDPHELLDRVLNRDRKI